MPTLRLKNSNVKTIACLVDEYDATDNKFCCLVDKTTVKYVIMAPGTIQGAVIRRIFEPAILSHLPPFPPGSWNYGYVARDPVTQEPTFVRTQTVAYAGVQNLWHAVRLSEVGFKERRFLRQDLYIGSYPDFNNWEPVIVKFNPWPWDMSRIERETTTYQRLCNHDIGPRFLGHLREGKNGRVVGIILELIEGARAAEPRDRAGCVKALKKLHKLGIRLGDVQRENFLVRDGLEVVLCDFGQARFNSSEVELKEEMESLKALLEDTDDQEEGDSL